MEVDEIQTNPGNNTTNTNSNSNTNTNNKLFPSRITNNGLTTHHFPPDDDDDDTEKRHATAIESLNQNRLRGWHHSSRIIRVSRASGGKDRHSKVWTSKGLRDRRVRLSVTTAIQFYDLQDRLGYDQPSKAVEWLINAASDAISELPSLNSSACFPETPKQLSDDKLDSANKGSFHCSSTSETSKGSGGLSLTSRPDVRVNRVKARERARERAAKDRGGGGREIAQNPSFTELLTSGITNNNSNNHNHSNGCSSPGSGIQQHHQIHQSLPMLPAPFGIGLIPGGGGESDSMTAQFSFVPEQHLIPIATASASDYGGQNFWIASSGGGFNRGTLQSNSSSTSSPHNHNHNHHLTTNSLFHHNQYLQRFSNSPAIDGPATTNIPFLFGTAAADSTHHHHTQFGSGFDARLHLCYGDPTRHSDHKGKGKN